MHSNRNASPITNDFLTMSHPNNYDEEIFVPNDLIEEYTKSATPADNFGNGGELSPTLERILIDLKSDPLIGSGTKATDSNRSSPLLLHQPARTMTQKPKQLSIQPVTNSQALARMDSMEFNKLVQNYLPNGAPSMHTPTNEYPPSRAGNSGGVVEDADMGNISSNGTIEEQQIANYQISSNASTQPPNKKRKTFDGVTRVTASIVKQEPIEDDINVDYTSGTDDSPHLPDRSSSVGGTQPHNLRKRVMRRTHIYTPDNYDDDERETVSRSSNVSRPRAYRLKDESEKDDKWRDKRDRNNESVRKSRQAAKEKTQTMAVRLATAEQANADKDQKIAYLEDRVRFLTGLVRQQNGRKP